MITICLSPLNHPIQEPTSEWTLLVPMRYREPRSWEMANEFAAWRIGNRPYPATHAPEHLRYAIVQAGTRFYPLVDIVKSDLVDEREFYEWFATIERYLPADIPEATLRRTSWNQSDGSHLSSAAQSEVTS